MLATAASGQDTYYSVYQYDGTVPEVSINDRSTELQAALLPGLYEGRSARLDILWVGRNDSALVELWNQQGKSILHILRELSGLEWQEREFPIYVVRHCPSLGSSDPLIIPLGSFGDGIVMEAAPEGSRLVLNLVYQLARRMLSQAVRPERAVQVPIAHHPLWRSGANRFDNLAMVLALSTCQSVIGIDSTFDAFGSAFWKQHHPGRAIFGKFFLNSWLLSPDRPLVDWVAAEAYNSELVRVTRPPRRTNTGPAQTNAVRIEGLPLRGDFGFSVALDGSGRLVVDKIDVERLAFACGLREGDRIYRAKGTRPRSHRDLIEKLFAGLDESGSVTLEVTRDEKSTLILIQPYDMINALPLPNASSDSLPWPPLPYQQNQ